MLEHGIVHGCKLRFVDLDVLVAVFPTRLGLSEADRADLWVCEHDRGDAGVVKSRLSEFRATEETVCEPAAGSDSN